MFGTRKPDPAPRTFDFKSQLSARPVRNLKVIGGSVAENGTVTVTVPLTYQGVAGFLSRIFKPRTSRTYRIDGPAVELWTRIDGKTRVEHLIEHLMTEHQLGFFEARAMVIHLLGVWMGRGLIAVDTRVDT